MEPSTGMEILEMYIKKRIQYCTEPPFNKYGGSSEDEIKVLREILGRINQLKAEGVR